MTVYRISSQGSGISRNYNQLKRVLDKTSEIGARMGGRNYLMSIIVEVNDSYHS